MPQSALGTAPLVANLHEPQEGRPLPRDHDEIDAGRDKVWPEAKAFTADPFDAVAIDRGPDFLRNDQAETARRARVGYRRRNEEDKVSARGPAGAGRRCLNSLEVCVTPYSATLRRRLCTRTHDGRPNVEACGLHGCIATFRGLLLVRRNCEALAPLATTVREHLLATARLHAGTEAVGTDAAEVMGLVRPFHDADPRSLGRVAERTILRAACQARVRPL
jgi:hypothetical protein